MERNDLGNAPDTEGAGSGADLPGSPSTSAAGTEAGEGSIGAEEAGTETGEPNRGFASGEGGLGGGASDPDPLDDPNPETNGVG